MPRRLFDDATEGMGVDEVSLGTSSALVAKTYPLDPHNMADSYFKQLDMAVSEFCSDENDLLFVINEVFESTYREVFGKESVAEFPGYLCERK